MMSEETPLLTKSTFLRAVQCPKSLALAVFNSELRTPPSVVDQFRMLQGQAVEAEARHRYPGGSFGRVAEVYSESVKRTHGLIEANAPVIYRAAFQAEGVRIEADVLERGDPGWRLIEIKSSSQAKPEYAWDLAVQVYVLRRSGLAIDDALLLHMNSDYVRIGALDYVDLFTETSMLGEVEELQPEVERILAAGRAMLAAGEIPDVPIGRYCTHPQMCDFKQHCWRHVPVPSVFDVYFIGQKAHELYGQGIERIEEIPQNLAIDNRSRQHVELHTDGRVVVQPEALRKFLGDLIFPLYFLDFETFAVPIPPYEGLSPYAKVPFQYSLHVQLEPGRPLAHHGFLSAAGVDPRPELLERLMTDTHGEGSIVVYNMGFEKSVLNGLGEAFPSQRPEIDSRIDRLVDLIVPFRQRAYWHPDMGGSNSLKTVLPVFAPDLSYEALDIGDGELAMIEYLRLAEETDPERVEAVRQALWAYCHLDTLAMVRILDGLRKLVGAGL